ncbi:hypothetical protein AGMMS49928_12950 [Spirochaetia bacterium]|nr:hypothetical protein AGMMS49928_12950 [Spirochaetia bacterium]
MIQKRRSGNFFIAISALLFFVFIFCPYYPVQLVSLFLLFIFLGSKIYSEYLIKNIDLRRRDTELRVFSRQWVTIELTAENRGPLPALMLAFKDSPGRLPVFRENSLLQSLPARSRRVILWQAYGSSRGIFTLGPASVRGSDPLGLFPFELQFTETTKFFVYPAAGVIGLKPPGGIPLGTLITGNPLYEDMTRCRSLRDYHPGDELRRINWKASARTGAMVVNEYESTLSYPLVIFLNIDPAAYPLHKRELHIERAIEAAAALCLMASRERQELGIIIHAPGAAEELSFISPAAFTLVPILERLAGLERPSVDVQDQESNGRPAAVLLDRGKFLPYGTRLVYAGPELTDEEYMLLNNLKHWHLTLEFIIIDERARPPLAPGNFRRYQMKEAGYEIL